MAGQEMLVIKRGYDFSNRSVKLQFDLVLGAKVDR